MAERTGTRTYVLHLHDARSKHADLRLEIDGVLASWAVPKMPSYDPSEARLAIRTKDHAMSAADVEGVIPEGSYGAGTILIWDRGTYRNLRARTDHLGMPEALQDGLLEVFLEGERLRGGWALKRTDDERWLLIKMDDEHADARRTVGEERSVVSGRTLAEVRERGETVGADDA
jgi:DNA ligase D-like protein (predicted 3'-phosphoesterase)